jgi:drug/metabolite transporter (DMT)-like permease
MTLLRRLFLTRMGPDVFGASVIQSVLAIVGVFTFVAGTMYLPFLGPTRMEMILALLLLAVVALLCTAVGQLAVVIERLDARVGQSRQSGHDA